MVNRGRPGRPLVLAIMLTMVAGCHDTSPDTRLAELAQRSLDEQARQNERLAEQSRQIAEASKQLVEADAQSRRKLVESQAALQQEIETARANVDQERNELERERREMAFHRHRDPVIAQALGTVGLIIACLLPLCLAGYVLYTLNRNPSESAELGELLVTEMSADEPLLLPPRSGAGHLEDHRPIDEVQRGQDPEPET